MARYIGGRTVDGQDPAQPRMDRTNYLPSCAKKILSINSGPTCNIFSKKQLSD